MPDGTPCLCAKCGKTWTPRRGPGRNPKTCSECKEQQRSSRPVGAVATCEHCSKDFVKRATNQKFCALDCYRIAERQKERLRERTRKRQCECSWCGAALNRKHGKKGGTTIRPVRDREEQKRRLLVRRSHFMTIIAAWVITVPVAALLAAGLYHALRAILG